MPRHLPEPFRIKSVEPIRLTTAAERQAIMEAGGNNMFNVPADKVYIDLLTDSGTGAMSDNQWAGLQIGDESYAGCRNWFHFEKTVRDLTGLKHIIPTHQGRVAENLLFGAVFHDKIVINNNHFDTTRANVLAHGGEPLDMVIDEGRDPSSLYPFKGNIDLARLQKTLSEKGPDKIALVMLTLTNNSGGGQPVSMENIRSAQKITAQYGIPLFFDACRFAENAYFIKLREPGYADQPVRDIVREMFSYADGCTMSAKKDGLVNIGGFLALNDSALAERVKVELIRTEGFFTYGGLAGRDLEAIARGLHEVLNDDYLAYRIGQVKFLGDLLFENDVPLLLPPGGHAIYLDATRFAPHIPVDQFPGQSIAVNLYLQSGIRSTEIGSFMFYQRDKETGRLLKSSMELVRLAIPRRVYTESHLRYVAESVIELYQKRDELRGLRIVANGESPLRHFIARLEFV
ncbi:MAG: tryptophanase [Candidatus Marinimicrobia bacterium]|nr:tryptophanase [Candidatus Neomarinimicrobiota bacterium]